MGRKCGSRPFYKAIPYTERNWEIIGRDAYDTMKIAEETAVLAEPDEFEFVFEETKPLAITNSFPAKYESRCPYCKSRIEVGVDICKAVFDNGDELYVHRECCQEKPSAYNIFF